MILPILYSYRRCPYAMRARMALKYAGIAIEIREITLKDKPAAMLKNVVARVTLYRPGSSQPLLYSRSLPSVIL